MKSEKTINQLITEFIENLDVTETSRKHYRANLGRWFRFCNIHKIDVRIPRRADVIMYKNEMIANGKSMTTIDAYLSAVRQFFAWLEACGIYENIAAGIHSPKRYKGFRKGYLQPLELNKVLSAMPRKTLSEIRDFAIVNTLVRTGMRRVELIRMNVSDIVKINEGFAFNLQRKGHMEKDQTLGVSAKVIDPIHEYLSLRKTANADEPLFINHSRYNTNERLNIDYVSRLVKASFRAVGIDENRFTAHSLRHTAAITAIRSGANITEVKEMLGHSSLETTRIYFSSIEAETRLSNKALLAIDRALDDVPETGQKQPILL